MCTYDAFQIIFLSVIIAWNAKLEFHEFFLCLDFRHPVCVDVEHVWKEAFLNMQQCSERICIVQELWVPQTLNAIKKTKFSLLQQIYCDDWMQERYWNWDFEHVVCKLSYDNSVSEENFTGWYIAEILLKEREKSHTLWKSFSGVSHCQGLQSIKFNFGLQFSFVLYHQFWNDKWILHVEINANISSILKFGAQFNVLKIPKW